MRLHILEGLQHAEGLINVPANWQVVDGGVHDHAIGIDDEQTAKRNAGFVVEDVVSRRDFLLQVSYEGVGDIAKSALIARGLNPGQVAELAVNGNAENLGVLAGKICVAVAERSDLRGSHEGEVEGVEEQDDVLAAILRQSDVLELLVDHCCGGEIGGLLTHTQTAVGGHDGSAKVQRRQRLDFVKRSRSDYQLLLSIYHGCGVERVVLYPSQDCFNRRIHS